RQVHGDQRVQQPRRETALHDQAPEPCTRREGLVEVERIPVPGQLGIGPHVLGRERERAARAVADVDQSDLLLIGNAPPRGTRGWHGACGSGRKATCAKIAPIPWSWRGSWTFLPNWHFAT